MLGLMVSCKSTDFIGDEKGWELLGKKNVNHLREKDVVTVKTREKFTALRLYAKKRDIFVKDVEVILINGDILRPGVENTIKSGEKSRLIELAMDGKSYYPIKFGGAAFQ